VTSEEYKKSVLKKFDLETDKLLKHLEVKLDNEENKLTIKMKKDYEILLKRNALHE